MELKCFVKRDRCLDGTYFVDLMMKNYFGEYISTGIGKHVSTETEARQIARQLISDHMIQKQYIREYTVIKNLQDDLCYVETCHSLAEAIKAYLKIDRQQPKALGIQNNDLQAGNLIIIQCIDGNDTLIDDYKTIFGWNNPEVTEAVRILKEKLIDKQDDSPYEETQAEDVEVKTTIEVLPPPGKATANPIENQPPNTSKKGVKTSKKKQKKKKGKTR